MARTQSVMCIVVNVNRFWNTVAGHTSWPLDARPVDLWSCFKNMEDHRISNMVNFTIFKASNVLEKQSNWMMS